LRQVVAEYRLLRKVIVRLYTERGDLSVDSRPKMTPLTVMNEAVDHAIGEAVDEYAAERDRVRDTFVAMLGHDLREPLHAMVFSANTLMDRADELDARTIKTAARIAAGGKRMERMIGDLLDFARGRLGGGFVIVPTHVDARAIIIQTVREIAEAHPDRVVTYAQPAAGNFEVKWDSDRIAQVVTNLVSNALVHGDDPIAVELTDRGDTVAIDVRNRGAIPPDMLPRLFDAFSLDAAPGQPRKGLGLGLYIVEQIEQAHGGDVGVESAEGTTTIRVRLPRHPPSG
jgi:signal transduction histidine kinase